MVDTVEKELPVYTSLSAVFSRDECESIIRASNIVGFEFGQVGLPSGFVAVDHQKRSAKIARFTSNESFKNLSWVTTRILKIVNQVNNADYNFDLSGLENGFFVAKYEVDTNVGAGHIAWHRDSGGDGPLFRKLSVSIQLSSYADYEGCKLRLFGAEGAEIPKTFSEPGSAIIFPSWTPHKVTAIRRGVRFALVAWIVGPRFR